MTNRQTTTGGNEKTLSGWATTLRVEERETAFDGILHDGQPVVKGKNRTGLCFRELNPSAPTRTKGTLGAFGPTAHGLLFPCDPERTGGAMPRGVREREREIRSGESRFPGNAAVVDPRCGLRPGPTSGVVNAGRMTKPER